MKIYVNQLEKKMTKEEFKEKLDGVVLNIGGFCSSEPMSIIVKTELDREHLSCAAGITPYGKLSLAGARIYLPYSDAECVITGEAYDCDRKNRFPIFDEDPTSWTVSEVEECGYLGERFNGFELYPYSDDLTWSFYEEVFWDREFKLSNINGLYETYSEIYNRILSECEPKDVRSEN